MEVKSPHFIIMEIRDYVKLTKAEQRIERMILIKRILRIDELIEIIELNNGKNKKM
jgi:hypothetical protein